MRRLAPNLFDRRFDDLVEAGRSRLPSLAPGWTDYNAHDPGITLMELLAWVGEAQLYALARMRRDERSAYAALLGLQARGPSPAEGMLWPDRSDRDSPFLSMRQAVVIGEDALVRLTTSETPRFRPTHRMLWTPGRVTSLRAKPAVGPEVDLTRSNEHGDRAFEPFGALAGPRDRLELGFACNGASGLFPDAREGPRDALWPIGVRVDPPSASRAAPQPGAEYLPPAALDVVMRIDGERIELPVAHDGTRGFMKSGVLLLDLSQVSGSPTNFRLEISAVRGFARPPRILRIEPGVLPIVQGGFVTREAHAALGQPGQRVKLAVPGLRFGAGAPAVRVDVVEPGPRHDWTQVEDLATCGPGDRVYELDTSEETLVFGNGVNGRLPTYASQILIDYPYCGGTAANTPRHRRWTVQGIAGVFGTNADAVGGGTDARGDAELRREARRRLHESHPLVTAADLEAAARAVAELEVARAEVVALPARRNAEREIVLVALRARSGAVEPAMPPETPRWLAALRHALLPRIPLGTRLSVRAPGYRSFSIDARIETMPRRDPAAVVEAVRKKLQDEFALVPRAGVVPRGFGVPVTERDLKALIRSVPGVRRCAMLTISAEGKHGRLGELDPGELARLDLAASRIGDVRGDQEGLS